LEGKGRINGGRGEEEGDGATACLPVELELVAAKPLGDDSLMHAPEHVRLKAHCAVQSGRGRCSPKRVDLAGSRGDSKRQGQVCA